MAAAAARLAALASRPVVTPTTVARRKWGGIVQGRAWGEATAAKGSGSSGHPARSTRAGPLRGAGPAAAEGGARPCWPLHGHHRCSPLPTACNGRPGWPAAEVVSAAHGGVSGGNGGAPSLAGWWGQRRARCRPSAELNPELATSLGTELEAHAAELLPHERQVAQKNEFLRKLQQLLADVVDGSEVLPFGSVVNGFWTPQSDVDICVRVPGASTRNAQINTLKRIAGELSRISSHHVEPRYGAQVPILHWAPQRPGMVSCDISINNDLAVVNSRLIGQYVRLDERLRTLGLCLKTWAHARNINDRSRGTISSFALVLMLINFLQRRKPPVLPSLQDIAFSRSQPPRFVHGVDCRFCIDPAEIAGELEHARGGGPANQEGTGVLLMEFFRHFGHEYRNGIIRIRDTRSVLPAADETHCYLVVDNPFEVGKDVANVDESQHDTIRKELRRAWSLLSHGHTFRELLRGPGFAEDSAKWKPLSWVTNNRTPW